MNTNKKVDRRRKTLVVMAIFLMVLLVGLMGGLTYSKYISTTTVNDTNATVASWGYVVTVDTKDLFGEEYAKDGATNSAVVADPGTVIVSATTGKSVVAPGAKGEMTITVNGTAEVLAELTISLTLDTDIVLIGTTKSGDTTTSVEYKPIKWTLTVVDNAVTPATTTTNAYNTLEELIAAINVSNQSIPVGTVISKTYTISYTWPLDSTVDDDYDTALGMWAAFKVGKLSGTQAEVLDKIAAQTGVTVTPDTTNVTLQFDAAVTVEQVLSPTTTS